MIPVLILAYLVETASLARRASQRIDELTDEARANLAARIDQQVPDTGLATAISAFYGIFIDNIRSEIRNGLPVPLLFVVACIPVAGEAAALLALSGDHATHATSVLTWLGLGIAAMMVLLPVWQLLVVIYRPGLPVVPMVRVMLQFTRALKAAKADRTPAEAATPNQPVGPTDANGDPARTMP